MDPSHLHADVVMHVLDHWYVRQEKQKAVLQFKRVLHPGHNLGMPDKFQPDLNEPKSSKNSWERIVGHRAETDTEPDMLPILQQHQSSQQDVHAGHPTVKKHTA